MKYGFQSHRHSFHQLLSVACGQRAGWMRVACLVTVAQAALPVTGAFAADEKPENAPKITFAEHVLPIFRARCGSCHNASDKRGGLALDNYTAMMAGGSSGDVIEPGDAGNSYLYSLVTHASEPKMPPNADKMPAAELATIEKWINMGAPENSGSSVAMKKKPNLAKIEVSNTRPAEVAIPNRYYGDPALVPQHANAVTALAVSPWASVAAVSGHRQVTIFDSKTMEWLGVLPFPEGQPQILKFSRDGSLLLAGGGRGGLNGRVVVYDVRTGERKIECGDEYDEVLAADISPDLSLIALGGPKRMLRIYSTATGELVSEVKKHTDWITAIEFSPDGVLLASGDRSNGLFVWEAVSGNMFYDLQGHKKAVSDISWRPDSNVVGSASEDNSIKLWEMQNGGLVKSWDAHAGGVTAMDYTRDGQVVSVGRDRIARLWNGDGAKVRDFAAVPDFGMEIAYDAETKRVLVGDWSGHISLFNADDGAAVSVITTNPPTIPMQVNELQQQANNVRGQLNAKQKVAADIRAKIAARQQAADQATAAVTTATAAATAATTQKQTTEKAAADQQGVVTTADGQLKAAQTSVAQANTQVTTLTPVATAAATALKQIGDRSVQAAAAVAAAEKSLADAKRISEELTKAAAPTEAETPLLETDEAVKVAVAERLAAATKAQQAVPAAEAAFAAATAAAQMLPPELAAAKMAADKAGSDLKAAQAALATATTAQTQHQQALEAAQKLLVGKQAEFAAAQKAEQAAAQALAAAQATAKTATAAAAPTADEQKQLAETDAAVKSLQDQVTALDAKLGRAKKIQNELATALQATP